MRACNFGNTAWLGGLLLILTVSPALADGELPALLSEYDKLRLQHFEETQKAAIAEATAGGEATDIAELNRVLDGSTLSFPEDFNPLGDWKCRKIKLGGDPSLVIYAWFNCRIADDGAGWRLEKLTGSQRTSGRLFTESDRRLIYVGAGHYSDEKPRQYRGDPERDQVAYVVRPSENRLRFEFPEPKFESRFDIIELRR